MEELVKLIGKKIKIMKKKFTSFLFITAIFFILLTGIFFIVTINYLFDDYGLFNSKKEKRIYMDEKDSKYLLSLKYVPSNFDAILVGPSYSDHIETKNITAYDIYNLSIAGGNISELNYLIKNVYLKRDLKFVIFCLDPFLTKDYDLKSLQIIDNPRLTTLFSIKIIKINLKKIYFYLFPDKDKYLGSEWGSNRIIVSKNHDTLNAINKRVIKIRNDNYHIIVNKKAIIELGEVVKNLKQKNTKILYYFHPVPYEIYSQKSYYNEYTDFKNKVILE